VAAAEKSRISRCRTKKVSGRKRSALPPVRLCGAPAAPSVDGHRFGDSAAWITGRGHGVALIDPHGELVERIVYQVPPRRPADVVYLNAADPSQPHGYNPLRHVREDRIALAASGFLEVFKKTWPEACGVHTEHILRNILMALLERPHATMHDPLLVLSDREFRKELVKSIRNETVRTFFQKEFERYTFGYRSDGIHKLRNEFRQRRIAQMRAARPNLTTVPDNTQHGHVLMPRIRPRWCVSSGSRIVPSGIVQAEKWAPRAYTSDRAAFVPSAPQLME
jgi:hypothetical protein